MKYEIFKPTDFDPGIGPANDGKELCTYEWASNVANEKINKLIESWKVVYGAEGNSFWSTDQDNMPRVTHKARLAFIEPIKKESCKHIPVLNKVSEDFFGSYDGKTIMHKYHMKLVTTCALCGVQLEATWREKI